ncbi:MAG: DUF5110 domain-containing protein [Saprospiraceae bacterium]|jgi:oligosaccharide 4-alpha-D-glucosyltransferase|nr:DUF5110 domain-containing protein [Saprospiraceae bacterium]
MENRIIWLKNKNCFRLLSSGAFVVALILVFINISFAQKGDKTNWNVLPYNENIVKLIYQPSGYLTSENISDAVILKPVKHTKIPIETLGNEIIIGDKTKVSVNYHMAANGMRGFSIGLADHEKIYGGGERALPLNRRGYSFNLHNNPWYGYENGADNLNYSVPFFQSSLGYGIFFDNPSSGQADIGKSVENKMNVTFSSGELNVYIIFGNTPEKILSQYHLLTGKQGLPPRWTLGNFMSRFGYSTEKQVMEISKTMVDEIIPFDGVIIDLFWFGDSIKGTMGNLEWVNKSRWPDPAGMIKKLKDKNKKTILITEPFILKSSLNYEVSKKYHATDSLGQPFVLTDFYFGLGGLIDIFRKDAANWFWEKHDRQNKIGVAAWWGDLGEPEKHPSEMYHDLTDSGFKRRFKANEVHNLYGHYWTKMLYENYSKHYPDTRLFSLNRSGFAGSQRYNIIPWSGDVSRSWSGFKAQLPLMLGMSMSGIPYIHSDAGGFAGGSGDYELYIRWLQFSAFTPILRPHGTALFELDPAAYSFPSEPALMPEPYKSMAREVIQLRYKLLPYNYTLAYQQTILGKPLVSPLYYVFPNDKKAEPIEDQFMWGENIMVVPITDKGAISKECLLPEGKWYELNFNQSRGEKIIEKSVVVPALLEKPVLFVKSGSFIPIIDKSGASTEDYTTDTLTVHYYFDNKKSSYTLFNDDGWSKSSLKNDNYELLTFSAEPQAEQLSITLQLKKGKKFPKRTHPRHIIFVIHGNDELMYTQPGSSKSNKHKLQLVNNRYSIDMTKNKMSFLLTKK